MKQLFLTDPEWAGLVLRTVLGAIMFPHGAQKMLGVFGGNGFRSTLAFFTETMKLPLVVSFLVIVIEFLGPMFLIAGLGSRLIAFLFALIMWGAILTTNYRNGLFMNWHGHKKGEGFEYHLLVIGICLGLLFTGSGKYSLDRLLVH
jgi:putative oxidoreductase